GGAALAIVRSAAGVRSTRAGVGVRGTAVVEAVVTVALRVDGAGVSVGVRIASIVLTIAGRAVAVGRAGTPVGRARAVGGGHAHGVVAGVARAPGRVAPGAGGSVALAS